MSEPKTIMYAIVSQAQFQELALQQFQELIGQIQKLPNFSKWQIKVQVIDTLAEQAARSIGIVKIQFSEATTNKNAVSENVIIKNKDSQSEANLLTNAYLNTQIERFLKLEALVALVAAKKELLATWEELALANKNSQANCPVKELILEIAMALQAAQLQSCFILQALPLLFAGALNAITDLVKNLQVLKETKPARLPFKQEGTASLTTATTATSESLEVFFRSDLNYQAHQAALLNIKSLAGLMHEFLEEPTILDKLEALGESAILNTKADSQQVNLTKPGSDLLSFFAFSYKQACYFSCWPKVVLEKVTKARYFLDLWPQTLEQPLSRAAYKLQEVLVRLGISAAPNPTFKVVPDQGTPVKAAEIESKKFKATAAEKVEPAISTAKLVVPLTNAAKQAKKLTALRQFLAAVTGDLALDLGAAPGSWTELLLKEGKWVIAIDPQHLELPGHLNLCHLQGLSETLKQSPYWVLLEAKRASLLVNDMKLNFFSSWRCTMEMLPLLENRALIIMTVKLTSSKFSQQLKQIAKAVQQQSQCQLLKVWQLANNRQEITLVLEKIGEE